ncbi:MAG: DUF6919 domain-containing protein [Pseudonocardiaceae bacterium]
MTVHRTARRWSDEFRSGVGATPVTATEGRACTWFGGRMSRCDVEVCLDAAGDEALAAVRTAHQVTVVDPVWGRDDLLWPTLAAAVGGAR